MGTQEAANLELAERYLRAIEAGATGEALAAFFHPEVVQHELPNRLVPSGAKRNLAEILASAERGQKVVREQRYELLGAVAQGERVALEVAWSARLAVPLGTLPEGFEMKARFAVFLEISEGKIIGQRNYDCFEPW